MRNVIAHHCSVLEDGTVIPDAGYEGLRIEQGPFQGACSFFWLPEKGTEPAMIIAEKSRREEEEEIAAFRWTETAWTGYVLRKIIIALDNNGTAPHTGTYDNHYQPTIPTLYSTFREPAWPIAENAADPGLMPDGRNDAPSYDPAWSIVTDRGNIYSNPPTAEDIELQITTNGAFIQVTSIGSYSSPYYYGAATTGITSGGDHGVWMYEMAAASGVLYEAA